MNYEKQSPLTQEEIDYIRLKGNINVSNLSTYPGGYIHVEINWDLPIKITRNEDEFKVDKTTNKENYWVVYPSIKTETSFDFKIKQFKNIDDALNYGLTEYRKWLDNRKQVCENIKRRLNRIK